MYFATLEFTVNNSYSIVSEVIITETKITVLVTVACDAFIMFYYEFCKVVLL